MGGKGESGEKWQWQLQLQQETKRRREKSVSLGQSRFKRVDSHARGARRTTSAKSTATKASETAVRYMEQPLL